MDKKSDSTSGSRNFFEDSKALQDSDFPQFLLISLEKTDWIFTKMLL